MTNVAANH